MTSITRDDISRTKKMHGAYRCPYPEPCKHEILHFTNVCVPQRGTGSGTDHINILSAPTLLFMLLSAVNAELLLSIYYLHVEMSGPRTTRAAFFPSAQWMKTQNKSRYLLVPGDGQTFE